MRFVDRSSVPVPKALSSRPFEEARSEMARYLALDEKERAQTRVPNRALPGKPPLLPALTELFANKCAFCEERRSDLQPFRFRPPNGLDDPDTPDAHIYYAWMSDLWQNLYPICPDCAPPSRTQFPLEGVRMPVPTPEEFQILLNRGHVPDAWIEAEAAMLLDPCADTAFGDHLTVSTNGILDAVSARGALTIDTFRLNRAKLIARRAQAIEDAVTAKSRDRDWTPGPEAEFSGAIAHYFNSLNELETVSATETMRSLFRMKAYHDRTHSLSQVSIQSFKSLAGVALTMPPAPSEDYATALMILGENATGKSSILEALALAMIDELARTRLEEAPGQFLLDPVYMGAGWLERRKEATVALTFTDEEAETSQRSLTVTEIGFRTEGDAPRSLPVFAYGAFRHYKSGQRNWRPDRAVRSLFHSDDLLSNPEKWLLTLDEARFDQVVRALRVIIGGGFRIIERSGNRCFIILEEGPEGHEVSLRTPLDTVSSGFRTILALTCDMMRWLMERDDFTTIEAARALVLIDEVEAHLHPRWKVSIMDGLRRAFPAMTFIVTTHDPLCIRGMRDGEVMVLQRVPGETRETDLPVFVDTLRELPDVTKLTVEQLLTSDLFDLFDTDHPRTGRAMADLADALAVRRAADEAGTALPEETRETLARFRAEIAGALPVGSTEVARIVEEAVAEYVRDSRSARSEKKRALREATKARIKRALSRETG